MTLSDWKHLEVTQEVLLELQRRIDVLSEELVMSAGIDPRLDAYRSGAIAALRDVVGITLEGAHDN